MKVNKKYDYLKTTDINNEDYKATAVEYLNELKKINQDTTSIEAPVCMLISLSSAESYTTKQKTKRQKEILPHLEKAHADCIEAGHEM